MYSSLSPPALPPKTACSCSSLSWSLSSWTSGLALELCTVFLLIVVSINPAMIAGVRPHLLNALAVTVKRFTGGTPIDIFVMAITGRPVWGSVLCFHLAARPTGAPGSDPSQSWMPSMKITDRRIMQTTQIATVVMCGLLIGYLIAEVSHSIQDWLLLTSLTVVLVCSLFVMFNDIWKRDA